MKDRFPIERELGQGGMATVYLARDLRHDRMVAVKVLRPEIGVLLGRERFEREIRVASSLAHPHIVPVYDSGEAVGFLYYVMPAIEGESLAARLERERHLAMDEAIRLLGEIAEALDHAHQRGLVHRDIKPGNIMLSGGHALVADFGIALAISHVEGTRLTETGLSMGTPAYMSPEQATGERVIDGRSDQYSLACVLYEMLGGDPPFPGSTPRSVMARHMADQPPPLSTLRPGLPHGIESAVQKALNKIPVDRFPSCGAFAAAVCGASGGAPAAPGRRRAPRIWRRIAVTAASVVAVAGVALAAWSLQPGAARIDSIAILPPEGGPRDTALAYRAQAVYEQLVTDLYKARGVNIKPSTAVTPYWRDRSIPAVVRGLGVGAVVSSFIVPTADSVRITVRLIRGTSQDIAATVDTVVGWGDAMRASEYAARAIVEAAAGRLSGASANLVAARTVDPRAYELVQRAQYTQAAPESALAWLRQAIAIDGRYSEGYARLSHALVGMMLYGFGSPQQLAGQAVDAARRAVRFDSASASAWDALANAEFWVNWNVDAAMAATREAVRRGGRPNRTLLLLTGNFDEALPLFDEDARNDPLSANEALQPCFARINAHRFREAIVKCREALAAHPEGRQWIRFETAWAFTGLGLHDSALAELEAAGFGSIDTTTDIVQLGAQAFVLGQTGRVAEGRRVVARLRALTDSSHLRDPYNLMAAYAGIGEDSVALRYLERVYQERWPSMMFAYVEPNLPRRFRQLPRVREIFRLVGFPEAPPWSAGDAAR